MTTTNIEKKLDRTARSLHAELYRNSHRTARYCDLLCRYGDLKDNAKELGIWDAFCTARGLHIDHNAGDAAC